MQVEMTSSSLSSCLPSSGPLAATSRSRTQVSCSCSAGNPTSITLYTHTYLNSYNYSVTEHKNLIVTVLFVKPVPKPSRMQGLTGKKTFVCVFHKTYRKRLNEVTIVCNNCLYTIILIRFFSIFNYCHDRARNVIPVLPLLFVSSLSRRH